MDNFPNITDLFEFLSDDPEWHKLSQFHEEVYSIIDKLLKELRPYLYKYQKEDIPDYRHYLCIFLYRTMRISHSINHLYIFGLLNEAIMLERPLLENIVNTKIFINSGHRAKSMRKIRLFELINDRKSYDYRSKDVKIYEKRYGITTAYIQEADQNLKERVEKGLQGFPEEEIEKAEKNINLGWHGEAPINAFKICNMESHYFLTYNLASSLLHVREPVPFGMLLDNNERELLSKVYLSGVIGEISSHLMDFKDICSTLFNNYNLSETIKKIKMRNALLSASISKEYNPKLTEFIKTE